MAQEVVNPTLARLAKQAGVSIEFVEQVARRLILDEEVKRQLEADEAERRRQPGRRPEWYRDYWMMLEVEWHRGQGMSRKAALDKVGKARKLSPDTVRKAYKKAKFPTKRPAPSAVERLMKVTPETDRDVREFFRRHPSALDLLLKREMERLQRKMDETRSQIEDLRRQEEDIKHPK